jgi:hypothetical protein
VPEPPTWWLMFSAAAILIWYRRTWGIRPSIDQRVDQKRS